MNPLPLPHAIVLYEKLRATEKVHGDAVNGATELERLLAFHPDLLAKAD